MSASFLTQLSQNTKTLHRTMDFVKLLCVCALVVSAANSEHEPQKNVQSTDANLEEEGNEGFCAGKEDCESPSARVDEGGKPGAKYSKAKQDLGEETKDKIEGKKEEGEGGDGEDSKTDETEEKEKKTPRKGEEERHLVKIEVLEEGRMCDRIKAANSDVVTVHLKGYKASDGSQFMTTYKEDGSEGLSTPFRMGVGDSIKGLELGIIGMCVDELRRLTVPVSLVRNGRNEFKGDKIPRGEELMFEVRLLGAVPNYQKGLPNLFKEADTNGDGVIKRDEMYDFVVGDEEMYPRGSKIADTLTDEQMQMADRNKDGIIQWEEFHLPKWDDM